MGAILYILVMSDRQVKKEIFEGLKQPQQKDFAKLILANQNKTLNLDLSLVICVLQNAPYQLIVSIREPST